MDGRLQHEYEARLAESLREMREANDETIRITREETEEIFERKLLELRDLADRNDGAADRAQTELRETRRRLDELSSSTTKLQAQCAAYEARIRDLEAQLAREQEHHEAALAGRDGEIRRMREQIENQLAEYRDLLDVKIQLDNEIQSYRKLLEAEETRLNLSQGLFHLWKFIDFHLTVYHCWLVLEIYRRGFSVQVKFCLCCETLS